MAAWLPRVWPRLVASRLISPHQRGAQHLLGSTADPSYLPITPGACCSCRAVRRLTVLGRSPQGMKLCSQCCSRRKTLPKGRSPTARASSTGRCGFDSRSTPQHYNLQPDLKKAKKQCFTQFPPPWDNYKHCPLGKSTLCICYAVW